jgi:hypothetical protein
MSDRRKIGPDDVRGLFRDAARGTADDIDRLLARVPVVFDEVRRHRAATPTVADALIPLARRWLPALATATVLLVTIAIVSGPIETTAGTVEDQGVDRLVLIGALGEDGTEDLLLRAIVGEDGMDAPDGTEGER